MVAVASCGGSSKQQAANVGERHRTINKSILTSGVKQAATGRRYSMVATVKWANKTVSTTLLSIAPVHLSSVTHPRIAAPARICANVV